MSIGWYFDKKRKTDMAKVISVSSQCQFYVTRLWLFIGSPSSIVLVQDIRDEKSIGRAELKQDKCKGEQGYYHDYCKEI